MRTTTLLGLLICSGLAITTLPFGCKDAGSDPSPMQSGLMVSQSAVSLAPGDSIILTITGGTAPYKFASQGNLAVAQASISGSELKILAIGVGTTQIVVQDSASPPLQFTVSANVGASLVMFSAQVQPIFTSRCTNQGCHPGNGAPFSLRVGESYGELVNITATTGPCAGIPRVKPFSKDSSALYRRILGTCGQQMPLGLSPLPSDERDLIEDWIDQGAQNN
jgi:hypothetical protein